MGYGRLPTMAGEFRIGTEPQLLFQTNGDPYCWFWAVTNSQKPNPDDPKGKWIDDRELWLKVTLWKNDGAENAANSLRKGDLVSIVCEPALGKYVPTKGPKAGIEQTYLETVRVISVGASIRFRSMPHGEQARQQQNNNGDYVPTGRARQQQAPPQQAQQPQDGEDPPF